MAASEARKRIPVALRRESSAGGWMRGMRFSGFTIIMIGLAVLAVVVLAPAVQSWVAQRQQIAALAEAKSALQEKYDGITAERERWNDSTFVVTQARERLGYVLPGEVSFLVINDLPALAASADPPPVSATIATTRTDWMQSLFASTMTAGLAPVEGPTG
jgi:cell division protein FtsB